MCHLLVITSYSIHYTKLYEAFTQARRAVGFGEYDLHDYAKQFGHSYLGEHLDSLVVQAVASRAYKAVNDYVLGKKGRPRFKGRNQFDSVEGKTNTSGLRWKDNRVVWNVLGGRRLILEPVITSYSIHYTKLYDSTARSRWLRAPTQILLGCRKATQPGSLAGTQTWSAILPTG